MAAKILNWFERFRKYSTQWVEDLPDAPMRNTVYIIGGREHPFYAAVVCPRKKCAKVIHLGISPEIPQRWKMTEHGDGTVSLSPSISIIDSPCKCHYFFRKGRIEWCDAPPLFVPEQNRRGA